MAGKPKGIQKSSRIYSKGATLSSGRTVKEYYCPVCGAGFLPIRSDIRRQIFCNECHEVIKFLVDSKKNLNIVE